MSEVLYEYVYVYESGGGGGGGGGGSCSGGLRLGDWGDEGVTSEMRAGRCQE